MQQSNAKPLLGVSACLLGQAVRYDGKDKKNSFIVDVLSQDCDFIAICPEAGAGLGIPRPPVHLVGNLQQARAIGRDDPSLDVTRQLELFAVEQSQSLAHIAGFIFKSRSPSCGLLDTPVHNPDNLAEVQTGSGIFARILTQSRPSLPVCDETMLNDPAFVHEFLKRVQQTHALMVAK